VKLMRSGHIWDLTPPPRRCTTSSSCTWAALPGDTLSPTSPRGRRSCCTTSPADGSGESRTSELYTAQQNTAVVDKGEVIGTGAVLLWLLPHWSYKGPLHWAKGIV